MLVRFFGYRDVDGRGPVVLFFSLQRGAGRSVMTPWTSGTFTVRMSYVVWLAHVSFRVWLRGCCVSSTGSSIVKDMTCVEVEGALGWDSYGFGVSKAIHGAQLPQYCFLSMAKRRTKRNYFVDTPRLDTPPSLGFGRSDYSVR